MKQHTLKRIEAIANQEFAYEGDGLMEEDMNYIGLGDDFDFGGQNNSFVGEHVIGRTYTLTITNSTDADRTVALNPGYYDTVARLVAEGKSVEAILSDGQIYDDGAGKFVTATSDDEKSIWGFLRFAYKNPIRVVAMNMQSTDVRQFDKSIKVENLSPISDLGTKKIVLTKYRPATQLATDKIDANLLAAGDVLDFNDQNLITLPIVAGATVVLNLHLGAISNEALKLHRRANRAHRNIRREKR